jgi:hypothetical protein
MLESNKLIPQIFMMVIDEKFTLAKQLQASCPEFMSFTVDSVIMLITITQTDT